VEAPSYKSQQKMTYTADDVNALADDLIWIETRLAVHTLTEDAMLKERAKRGSKADLYIPAPWLKE
jgi:hypothetical protein